MRVLVIVFGLTLNSLAADPASVVERCLRVFLSGSEFLSGLSGLLVDLVECCSLSFVLVLGL